MEFTSKSSLFVFLVAFSFLFNFCLNQYNLSVMSEAGKELRLNQSIPTADDQSYLSPVRNYLETGVWKESEKSVVSYYKRSPGYGFFLLPFLRCFDEGNSLFVLTIVQCCFQASIAGMLFLLLTQQQFSKITAGGLALVFGVFPAFNGYSFYTLTEGVTPFLIFLIMYLSFQKGRTVFILLSIVFSVLLLTRPVFLVLLLLPFWYFMRIKINSKWLLGTLGLLICFTPFALWMNRNYSINESSLSLHPIYDAGNANCWRLPHQSIYELVKQYHPTGSDFHDWNKQLLEGKQKGLMYNELENPLSIFNDQVVIVLPKDSLKLYIGLYYQSLGEVNIYANQNEYSLLEQQVANKFLNFKSTYQNAYFFDAHIKIPSLVFKQLVWSSNLNLFIFWSNEEQFSFNKTLAYLSSVIFTLIFLFYLLLPLLNYTFFKKYWILFAAVFIYLFYLIYVQRGLEKRYIYPLFGPLFFLALMSCKGLIQQLFKRRNASDISSGNE